MNNISKGTLIRTAVLLLAFINQALTLFGVNPIPIESEELECFLSLAFTIGAAVWGWWKNNSITKEAIQADEYMKTLKEIK